MSIPKKKDKKHDNSTKQFFNLEKNRKYIGIWTKFKYNKSIILWSELEFYFTNLIGVLTFITNLYYPNYPGKTVI